MLKWTEPKRPPPGWLKTDDEITHEDVHRYPVDRFVVECMEACLRLGCDVQQAAGVTANARNESANGQSYRCFNLGGWKITKAYADKYRAMHDDKGPPWFRAPGNKASGATPKDLRGGDPPWCFYRVFESLDDFLAEWLKHFVPRPADPAPYKAYRHCGELFWAGVEWFPALIDVGYKGQNTRENPTASIVEHHDLVHTSVIRWAQARLGSPLVVDGRWGPKSRSMCLVFQKRYGLAASGEPDAATLAKLAQVA